MATDRPADRRHDGTVTTESRHHKRDQIWGAGLILDELDDLGVRIAQSSR